MAFPTKKKKKNSVWTIFPSAPRPSPLKNQKFYLYCRLAVSECCLPPKSRNFWGCLQQSQSQKFNCDLSSETPGRGTWLGASDFSPLFQQLGWDLPDHLQNPKPRNPEKSQKVSKKSSSGPLTPDPPKSSKNSPKSQENC